MPVLPVSDFWRRSFHKYYKLRWPIESDLAIDPDKIEETDRERTIEDRALNPWWIKCNIAVIITASLLINIGVLLIPLSEDQHSLDSNLYVTYQSVYTMLSYPCTVQIFEVALPTTLTNRFYRYILLPFPVYLIIIALYILYSPIVPGISTSNASEHSRTLGPFILSTYAILIFGIIIYGKRCCRYCKKHKSHRNPLMNEEPNEFDTATGVVSDYGNTIASIQFSKSQDTFGHTSTINSLLLFRYSETDDDSLLNQKEAVFVYKERYQIIAAALSTAGISATYFWTQYLTWQWRKALTAPHSERRTQKTLPQKIDSIMLLYPVFWIGINIIKFIVIRFSRYCDSNKTSRYSLELIVSFFLTSFYYVYYRNLFLHIDSYASFILVKVSHIFLELTLYLLRMSPLYFEKTDALQNKFKDGRICCNACCGLLQPLVAIMYDPAPYHIWCVRVSIDYTMQFILSIGSGIGYIVGVIWLKYGYNQHFYDIKNIETEQFEKALFFTTVAIFLEFVIYFVIHYVMKHLYHIHVIKHWNALIRHRKGYIWYFIFILQHVLTDVWIAKLLPS